MIARRIAGLIILAVIVIGGAIAYLILRIKVRDAESDLMIVKRKDLKGRDSDGDPRVQDSDGGSRVQDSDGDPQVQDSNGDPQTGK